jgi:hypothetical protein
MMEEMVSRIKEISDLPGSLPLSSDERLNKMMDDFLKSSQDLLEEIFWQGKAC